jgi:hypothetical protein
LSGTSKPITSKTTFYVDRTLARTKLSSPAISPNGDGVLDATALSFQLTAAARVRVELWRAGKVIAALFDQSLGAGPAQVPWNGNVGSKRVADGSYRLVVKATDAVTTSVQELPVVVDTTPPRLRLVSRPSSRFWTNEPAIVTATLAGRRVAKHVRAGYFVFPALRGVRHFTLVATDPAGNKSLPLRG